MLWGEQVIDKARNLSNCSACVGPGGPRGVRLCADVPGCARPRSVSPRGLEAREHSVRSFWRGCVRPRRGARALLVLARTAGAACGPGSTLAPALGAHGVPRSCGVPAGLLHGARPTGLSPRLPPCKMDSQPLDRREMPWYCLWMPPLCLLSFPPSRGERWHPESEFMAASPEGSSRLASSLSAFRREALSQLPETQPLCRADGPPAGLVAQTPRISQSASVPRVLRSRLSHLLRPLCSRGLL